MQQVIRVGGLNSVSVAWWTAARRGLTEHCTDRRDLCPVLAMMTSAERLVLASLLIDLPDNVHESRCQRRGVRAGTGPDC